MPRVKRGVPAHARHRRVLKLTKGHRASNRTLYRRAHESMLHALSYMFRHRRERKGDLRRLWIVRINAGSRAVGLSYSQFMHGLKGHLRRRRPHRSTEKYDKMIQVSHADFKRLKLTMPYGTP